MGKLDGKVAFITGAARGQGRSHAVRLAREGADIIAIDLFAQIDSVAYSMATPADLDQTVKEIEALDRQWRDRLYVTPPGDRHTVRAAAPRMIEQGDGGPMVLTSSTAGIKDLAGGEGGGEGYTSAKHGVVGLMRAYANEFAKHHIRVNTVHPTGVNTPMVVNEAMQRFIAADPTIAQAMANLLPVEMLEPGDISNAILWLVSDDARYVTGVTLPVDAGFLVK